MIIRHRAAHGGEVAGITKFRLNNDFFLDDWPIFNQLRGLLENGYYEKFMMTLYAHIAFHQGRNTFFAPEGTWYDKLDSMHCVPSQLTVPLALRWMLVYEEKDSAVLNLLKGVPDSWLRKKIKVQNAPTEYGHISFETFPSADSLGISIDIKTNGKVPGKILIHLYGLFEKGHIELDCPSGKDFHKTIMIDLI